MQVRVPQLAIVPTESLVPHEDHDPSRAEPLARRIREMGVLRDPPIVMPFPNRPGQYMVLDGANRTFACRLLGLPHILVQVVEPDSPQYRLASWNHVLWDWSSEAFLDGVRQVLPWDLLPSTPEKALAFLEDFQVLLIVAVPPDRYFFVPRPELDAPRLMDFLRSVVNLYLNRATLERTGLYAPEELRVWFPQWQGLVVFPTFTVQEVFAVLEAGKLFPSGITRFMIFPRALRVHYPLEELRADRSLEEKNRRLRAWLQERFRQKGVRYYGDTVILFDE